MEEQKNEDEGLGSMIKDFAPIRFRDRKTEELLYDITNEYCTVSANLKKLNRAIESNPESVSDYHKNLWKTQAEYMDGYKKTLADRIKDILNNN